MNSAHLSEISRGKGISWKAVVLLLIFFWPVGLLLLFLKIGQDKAVTLKSSKTVGVIGWVLVGMAVFYLVGGLTGQTDASGGNQVAGAIGGAAVIGGGGVCLLWVSRRMKENGRKYKKYIDLVVNQEQTSLDNIAAAMALPYETVRRDLQKMIDSGYFAGACIREADREIVRLRPAPAEAAEKAPGDTPPDAARTVVCPGCGARNVIPAGRSVPCEYCGTPLT